MAAVETLALALAAIFFRAALYSPRKATLVLSDRGLTLGGGAVPFLFSDGFAVALVITITVVVFLSFLFLRPLSSGGVALRCVISA